VNMDGLGQFMKILFRSMVSVLFIFVSVNLIAGEKIMYKWTDDKGEVHYSERAPKGVEYKTIRTYVDSNVTSSAPVKLPKTPNEAKETKSSYDTWRDENCTIANQNLEMLKNAKRMGMDDGQGGTRLMSDEEKAEKIAEMEAQRDKYCEKSEEK